MLQRILPQIRTISRRISEQPNTPVNQVEPSALAIAALQVPQLLTFFPILTLRSAIPTIPSMLVATFYPLVLLPGVKRISSSTVQALVVFMAIAMVQILLLLP
ncbi:hypothetical protein GGS21DRAFT_506710 [Xylaria nigripes]|nr:hypothetical protein GGS21DRAFT_506710 [Xylaria nigripes]